MTDLPHTASEITSAAVKQAWAYLPAGSPSEQALRNSYNGEVEKASKTAAGGTVDGLLINLSKELQAATGDNAKMLKNVMVAVEIQKEMLAANKANPKQETITLGSYDELFTSATSNAQAAAQKIAAADAAKAQAQADAKTKADEAVKTKRAADETEAKRIPATEFERLNKAVDFALKNGTSHASSADFAHAYNDVQKRTSPTGLLDYDKIFVSLEKQREASKGHEKALAEDLMVAFKLRLRMHNAFVDENNNHFDDVPTYAQQLKQAEDMVKAGGPRLAKAEADAKAADDKAKADAKKVADKETADGKLPPLTVAVNEYLEKNPTLDQDSGPSIEKKINRLLSEKGYNDATGTQYKKTYIDSLGADKLGNMTSADIDGILDREQAIKDARAVDKEAKKSVDAAPDNQGDIKAAHGAHHATKKKHHDTLVSMSRTYASPADGPTTYVVQCSKPGERHDNLFEIAQDSPQYKIAQDIIAKNGGNESAQDTKLALALIIAHVNGIKNADSILCENTVLKMPTEKEIQTGIDALQATKGILSDHKINYSGEAKKANIEDLFANVGTKLPKGQTPPGH